MKVLHTADWHLGHRLCDQERQQEHQLFLDWLLNTIESRGIDLLIVAGDIFDTANPPHQALEQYYEFLMRVRQTCCKNIVIIAGNHDSPGMLNAPKDLLRFLNIFVVGKITDTLEGQTFVIKNGSEQAAICAVPFLRYRDIISQAISGAGNAELEQQIKEGIIRHYQEAARHAQAYKDASMAVIATGHLFAAGSETSESEREIHVGNLGQVSAEQFPQLFDYVALGHIHRPQKVRNRQHIRYSGSPIALSFSENVDRKIVIQLEFKKGQLSGLEEIETPVSRRLLRFKGNIESIETQLRSFDDSSDLLPVWAEVQIETETFDPYLAPRVHEMIKGRNMAALKIGTIFKATQQSLAEMEQVQQLEELKPLEVFKKKCESDKFPLEENPEVMRAFEEVLSELEENE